jgi:hypothetical protein
MDQIIEPSIGIDGVVFPERRSERRRRVLKGATVRFNKGFGAYEGVVRNMSGAGARLDFGEMATVPPRFDLYIAGEDEPRAAEIRWRSAAAIGVAFV